MFSNYVVAIFVLGIALAEGDANSRVDVKFMGSWGSVCDDSFGVEEAKVVCRMLGKSTLDFFIFTFIANAYALILFKVFFFTI